MYSQNNEQQFITDYFQGKVGIFMDIGGYNPFKFSNTRKLYELGWSGIYVEPSPICFSSFVKEYENEPRIELINKAVVSTDEKEITLYEANGDAVSTSNNGHRDKWLTAGVKYAPISVPAMHIKDLITPYKGQINFLSIDVEASNYDLFMSIPNDFLITLDMLCIEHDNWHQVIQSTMEQLGFKKIMQNGENIIMVK